MKGEIRKRRTFTMTERSIEIKKPKLGTIIIEYLEDD